MESYFVLLVFCLILTPLFGENYSQYDSGKCYKYDGLLNDMLPIDYLEDPVKNLRQVYLTINLESKPDEKYYLTVLKTNDAIKQGLIKPVSTKGSRIYHAEGIRSEVYLTAPGYFENRLISHSDISRARRYFEQRRDEVCGTAIDEKVQVGTENRGNPRKCLRDYQIRDLKDQMEGINLNVEPGILYYKLVLKTNRAVHCKQLTIIEGTLITGALGVKTEEYLVEDDHTTMRLVSINDRRQARAFFKERKVKHQPIHSTEPSYSSINEGHNKNNKKVAAVEAGAAGALLIAHKAGMSSSDESDNKHDLGGSKLVAAPVVVPHTAVSNKRPDVPLHPIKDTHVVPTTSSTTIIHSPTPTLVTNPPAKGSSVSKPPAVNTDPVLTRQPSLERDEDIDLRVTTKTEVSVTRKTAIQVKT